MTPSQLISALQAILADTPHADLHPVCIIADVDRQIDQVWYDGHSIVIEALDRQDEPAVNDDFPMSLEYNDDQFDHIPYDPEFGEHAP